MYRLGIDLGSSYTKGVLVDENNRITGFHCVKSGYNFTNASSKIISHFESILPRGITSKIAPFIYLTI